MLDAMRMLRCAAAAVQVRPIGQIERQSALVHWRSREKEREKERTLLRAQSAMVDVDVMKN